MPSLFEPAPPMLLERLLLWLIVAYCFAGSSAAAVVGL
jgi:hypothetical protein